MRSARLIWVPVALVVVFAVACGPVKPTVGNNNNGWNTNNNTNQNWNNNNNNPQNWVRFQGTVWSPGADLAGTLEQNRFPIPSALVAAFASPPSDLPQQMYCNECVEIPSSTPNTLSDPVTGTFELSLIAGATYYLTVQKGEFRRVRQIVVPNTPGQVFSLETGPGSARPPETTLPVHTDLAGGDNIPKIAMIDASYEDQQVMFEALGFNWSSDVDLIAWNEVSGLLTNPALLNQYNLIIVPCGGEWPGGAASGPLREWVRNGGKLYVDDWNYDFVEQVWPERITFWTNGGGVCGSGSTAPSIDSCNSSPSYSFTGSPGDNDFADWIGLPNVNGNNPVTLEGAWNYIYDIHAGEVGIDPESGTGPNGEVYLPPKVWMYNTSTPFGTSKPATVSWPFHCGRVLFTVYHTHSGSGGTNYQLLLQEKIMMYLIMQVQTCSTGPIVN